MDTELKDALELLETARHLADDHIHGYDYHVYGVICDAIDVADDLLRRQQQLINSERTEDHKTYWRDKAKKSRGA